MPKSIDVTMSTVFMRIVFSLKQIEGRKVQGRDELIFSKIIKLQRSFYKSGYAILLSDPKYVMNLLGQNYFLLEKNSNLLEQNKICKEITF